jgi:hypothetical protein
MRLAVPRAALILALVGPTLTACAHMGGPDGMPRRPATVTVSGVGQWRRSPIWPRSRAAW